MCTQHSGSQRLIGCPECEKEEKEKLMRDIEVEKAEAAAQGIKHLQRMVHKTAVDHGWYANGIPTKPTQIALMHSELSEMLEADRKHKGEEAYGLECADLFIRLLDHCEAHGINLAEYTLYKMRINEDRPYTHGGLKY